MEQNSIDATDDLRRHQELVRELSQLVRQPRRGIDYRRLHNRITVDRSVPQLAPPFSWAVGNGRLEVLLTEHGVAIGYTGLRTSRSGRKRVGVCHGLRQGRRFHYRIIANPACFALTSSQHLPQSPDRRR